MMQTMMNLLLHLVTAVCTGEVNYESQLGTGIVDILALERTLTRLVRPCQSLVQIDQTIDRRTHGNHTPAGRTTNLYNNG